MTGTHTNVRSTVPEPDTTPKVHWAPLAVRIASHIAVWVTVLASAGIEAADGWRPVGDNAAIASRAFQTFSAHPPVVGMLSTAGGSGRALFDPGPLLFWLLAVPVRLDATQGMLWGAAVLAGVVLSVAIEAVWTTQLWVGCGVIAFAVADLFWLTPSVFENISWNAYFPIPFFIATLALAWVVASGRFGWWPVLVFTASVAAQAHLLFSIPCAALALIAPLLGLAVGARPRRLRWLWIGLGVALACWIVPILQQLFGKSGNLSALAGSQSGQAKFGVSFALSLLGRVALPSPVWLAHQPTTTAGLITFETAAKQATGVAVLVVLGATVVWGRITRRSPLAAAASVSLLASVAVLISFAIFPTKNYLNLFYLLDLLWPLGIMIWATVAWGVVSVVSDTVRRWRLATSTSRGQVPPAWQGAGAVVTIGLLALVAILGIGGLQRFTPTEQTVSWDAVDAASVINIARAVERVAPEGPVALTVVNGPKSLLSGIWISEGVAWKLESDGWAPGVNPIESNYTGLVIPKGTVYRLVTVTMDGTRVVSVSTSQCQTGDAKCPGFG